MTDLAYTAAVAIIVVALWWASGRHTHANPRHPRKQPLGTAGPPPPPNGQRVATKPE